jgi:uncharacterized membrane protein YdjX (TVP38/TMEM64 family)
MDGESTRNHALVLMRILSALIILVTLSLISRHHLSTTQLIDVINDLGGLAPLGFVLFATLLKMIFMPPMLIIGVGWLLFGVVFGGSYAVLGIMAGSCLAFIIGRYFIGEVGITLSEGRVRRTLEKVNNVIKLHGLLTVLGLKLLFFTNAGLDYSVSRTEVKFRDYFCGVFAGLMPGSFIHLYLFEMVLRPAFVVTESPAAGLVIENLLAENLTGNMLLEQGFIWLVMHILTRICGVILLGILANKSRMPPTLAS